MHCKLICTKTMRNFQYIQKGMLLGLCLIVFDGQAMPQIADREAVSNCRYLNDVDADSGYGKKFDWQSLAKYSALHKAEQLGASHVVWDRLIPVGAFNGIAVAKAYQCNS